MNKTRIEWARNPDGSQGYTWNPITGCLNGCDYCYARKLANTRLRERYLANQNVAICGFDVVYIDGKDPKFSDPFYPRFWPERIADLPIKCYEPNKHLGIFTCDMSDLFGIGVPEEWTQRIMTRIRTLDWHRFYLLTKQPQNLARWSPFPDNCWSGVTATDSRMAFEADTNLAHIEAKVKYISFEPLLERIESPVGLLATIARHIDWVIIGAQTPYSQRTAPKWEWVEEIIDACVKAGIPYFLKNNLEPIVPKVYGGDGPLIQEMPANKQK